MGKESATTKSGYSSKPTKVFISATSADLGSVRELVKQALLTMDCMPVEQSNFPPDHRGVEAMLEDKIRDCEAVVQIVGLRYGAEPTPDSLPEGRARRSYTQMEADVARRLGKKLYLFICPESFPYDEAGEEAAELRELQLAYRRSLTAGEHLFTDVASPDEVGLRMRELRFELESLKSTIGRDRKRFSVLLLALALALGGVALGVWWWVPETVEQQFSYDRDRVREQLTVDIREEASRRFEAAGDDWRSVIEVEKWRDQQLGDLDRLLDNIEEAFASDEASEGYRRALKLVETKGVDEALAYLDASGRQRLDAIAAQANRRDREETELRKLLQEQLLTASLLQSKFQFDAAEAIYRSVLNASPTWVGARNDFAWFLCQRGGLVEPEGGKLKLEEAHELCLGTLALISNDERSQRWATAQLILSSVLRGLSVCTEGELSLSYLTDSVHACREALEVYSSKSFPSEWAVAQHNLGIALIDLGERVGGESGREYQESAIEAIRQALHVRRREDLLLDWASSQDALGNALQVLGRSTDGKLGQQYLLRSVEAYRDALEVRTYEDFPQDWANTQSNLGGALGILGHISDGEVSLKYFEEAISAFGSALRVFRRESMPQDWARVQSNLGGAMQALGYRVGGQPGRKYLEDAILHLRKSLEIRTRESVPQDWAFSQFTIGKILLTLGARYGGQSQREYLIEAVDVLNYALEVFSKKNQPEKWEVSQKCLALALNHLVELSVAPEINLWLQQSTRVYEQLDRAAEEGAIDSSGRSDFLGALSFLYLQSNAASQAHVAAEEAIRLAPGEIWLKTNLLTAHLLLDEWEAARAILDEHGKDDLGGGQAFWQAMLNDFDALEKFKVTHPNIDRMRGHILEKYSEDEALKKTQISNNVNE